MGGYLVCVECGGYYELQPGELPTDFTNKCECGGELKYKETLESSNKNIENMTATIICPHCGAENPEDAKLCKSCKRILRMPSKSPITSTKKQSKDGIFETWNKQSNGLKALSLIGVCCVGLILIAGISAMLSPDKNTQNNLSQSPTTTPSTTQDSSVTDYANHMKSIAQKAQSVLQDVTATSDAYASGASDASTTISKLQKDKATIDSLLSEMQGLTPPSGLQHAHSLYLSAFQDISSAIGLSIKGLQDNDVNEVNQGTEAMNSATSKLDQANSEVQSYNQ